MFSFGILFIYLDTSIVTFVLLAPIVDKWHQFWPLQACNTPCEVISITCKPLVNHTEKIVQSSSNLLLILFFCGLI